MGRPQISVEPKTTPMNLRTLCASCHKLAHSPNFMATSGQRKPCSLCEMPAMRAGLCWTHHTRLMRHGDPLVRKVKHGSSWSLERADLL